MTLKSMTTTTAFAILTLFACQPATSQTYATHVHSPQMHSFNQSPPSTTHTSSFLNSTANASYPAVSPFSNRSTSTLRPNVQTGLAQRKASQAASGQIHGHVGGGLGGAAYEGVGWSNQSPQAAIQNCCYWGTRPVSQIGVARARNGCWFACVLYR
jgi:hypothetical protein